MPFRVTYTVQPAPPGHALTQEQLAERDARFARTAELQRRGVLQDVVQDSADLQDTHLTLRTGAGEWCGTPDARGEPERLEGRPLGFGWSEAALCRHLGLDVCGAELRAVGLTEVRAALTHARRGLLFAFAASGGVGAVTLRTRLNLTGFFDRLEVEALCARRFAGFDLLRLHRLTPTGQVRVLRADLRVAQPSWTERFNDRAR